MSTPWSPSAPPGYPVGPSWDGPHRSWTVAVALMVLITVLVVGFFLWIVLFGPHTAGGYYPRGWFFFPFGFLFLLFVLFLGVRIAFWSARWGGNGWGGRRYGATAILRARYARGEITREQFLQMRRDLDDPQ